MYGYISYFIAVFAKGNNFCDFVFASLEDKLFTKRCLFKMEFFVNSALKRLCPLI